MDEFQATHNVLFESSVLDEACCDSELSLKRPHRSMPPPVLDAL